MRARAILLGLPLVIVTVLLQAWWWVPTYESQLRGNPERARTFIEGSIGDAKFLNPILSADSASSRITDMVFDGLLRLDEDLSLAPGLAREWQLYEWAYIAPAPGQSAEALARSLESVREQLAFAARIKAIEVTPPSTREVQVSVPGEGDAKPTASTIELRLPARVRLTLDSVYQDLAAELGKVFGEAARSGWDAASYAATLDARGRAEVARQLNEAIGWVEHNPVLEFRLRPDVRFHDGHALDADDVRFTFDAIMSGRNLSPRRADFEPVARLEVLARDHVRIVYKRLHSPALFSWTMGILPEHLLNDDRREAEITERNVDVDKRAVFGMRDMRFNRQPVGSGPFRFVRWSGDELIELRANPDYWQGSGELRRFVYRVIPDLFTQELEFRSGALDSYAPQPHQVARYRSDDRYRNFSTPQRGYSYIAYNLRRAPFNDERVRRALSHGIDVGMIMRYVLHGEGERVTGPYPPSSPWTERALEPLAFDPERARALLAEAGYSPGDDGWLYKDGKRLEFNLITNNGNPVRKAILTIAQDNWRQIGVKCNTQVFEWAVFLEDFVNPGTFDALILGWRLGVDPDQYQLWHSSQAGFAQLNFTGLRDSGVDRLLERIRREYEPLAQKRLTGELHRLIASLQPYTFLFAPRATQVLDRKWHMRRRDGGFEQVRPVASGDLYYHLRLWRKQSAPELAPGG